MELLKIYEVQREGLLRKLRFTNFLFLTLRAIFPAAFGNEPYYLLYYTDLQ